MTSLSTLSISKSDSDKHQSLLQSSWNNSLSQSQPLQSTSFALATPSMPPIPTLAMPTFSQPQPVLSVPMSSPFSTNLFSSPSVSPPSSTFSPLDTFLVRPPIPHSNNSRPSYPAIPTIPSIPSFHAASSMAISPNKQSHLALAFTTDLPTSVSMPPAITSSVSSPSAPDSDCSAQVDDLLEGIERIRHDDLCNTSSSLRAFDIHSYTNFFVPRPTSHIPTIASPIPSPPTSASTTAEETHGSISSSSPTQSPQIRIPVVQGSPDFPRLFKVHPCPHASTCQNQQNISECFYYHNFRLDRRRINVATYKPHMCRFVDDPMGCRKGDRCPFSHNDFERRYHPDRFGKETCRDFLRSECPRQYCTFRHHVSQKVEVALNEMQAMCEKEMLQLVLKMDEERGRSLCDKLLRRFGHSKKHSGWKLERFTQSKDDVYLKEVCVRVDSVKRRLRNAGEKKWAASLKMSTLRDMMSGVRKVAEEMRERCRSEIGYEENGGSEIHRLIRGVFSNTNWSCHSMEGDNPFLVTPENQLDALCFLERLVDIIVERASPDVCAEANIDERASSQPSWVDAVVASDRTMESPPRESIVKD